MSADSWVMAGNRVADRVSTPITCEKEKQNNNTKCSERRKTHNYKKKVKENLVHAVQGGDDVEANFRDGVV